MKMIIWILWPSFTAAGIAEVVFFTLIDPQQLFLLGQPINVAPMTAYSLGFLMFWLVCAGACLMTYLMLPADVKKMLAHHTEDHPDLTRRGRAKAAQ